MQGHLPYILGGSTLAGGFIPTDIGGCVLWLRSDLGITKDGGNLVSVWADQSGNGNDVTQNTDNNKPIYNATSGPNSTPCLEFNGTTQYFGRDSVDMGTASTVFIVITEEDDSTRVHIGSATANNWTGRSGTYLLWYVAGSVAQWTSLYSGDGQLQVYRRNGSIEDLHVNGGLIPIASGDVGAGSWSFTRIAGIDAGYLIKGKVSEIIIYDSALSDVLLEAVESYLSSRYAITLAATPPPWGVVYFGDSVIGGTGASDEAHTSRALITASKSFISSINSGSGGTVLQNTIQNTVDTIGAAADNNGRDTYITRILNQNLGYTIILYGLNDLRLNDAAFSVANFQNDLAEIIDGLVAGGFRARNICIGSPSYIPAASYALGGPQWNGGSLAKHTQYIAACAAVAAAKGTKYVDIYQAMADNGGDALMADDYHPNDAGHQVIANAFLSVITSWPETYWP